VRREPSAHVVIIVDGRRDRADASLPRAQPEVGGRGRIRLSPVPDRDVDASMVAQLTSVRRGGALWHLTVNRAAPFSDRVVR